MWHGSLEGDELRRAWLREVSGLVGVPAFEPGTVGFAAAREARIDALADAVEEHVDVAAVLDLVSSGAPPLPLVRGGLA
jgi:adenosylcobyric acid synthase